MNDITLFDLFNLLLIVGLILSAALVVLVRGVINAVIASAVTGTFLTLLFFHLEAPDVALSEAAVGAVAVPMVLLISLAKIRGLLDNPSEVE
jgi:energy-converting hydrogenase B subunit D